MSIKMNENINNCNITAKARLILQNICFPVVYSYGVLDIGLHYQRVCTTCLYGYEHSVFVHVSNFTLNEDLNIARMSNFGFPT